MVERFNNLSYTIKPNACLLPRQQATSLSGGNSEVEPPDPIPNSEVKRFSADGSVGFPHVRVGHRQVLFEKPLALSALGVFF